MTNSNTTIDIISTMIKKTKDEKSIRKGLSDANIKSIINKIDYNDHSELIKNIWNNPISKDLLMGKLCELLPEDYIMKIEKIKNIGCKINEADKETITNNISDRLMKLLESGNIKDLAVVCDFVTGKENTGFINNKVKLKEGLKTYSMSDFKSTLKADEYECYNNKRKEAMKKLK